MNLDYSLPFPALSVDDLDRTFFQLTESTWRQLAGRRIFLTGGTGFVGKWMLATLLEADSRLCLECKVTVLSRDPGAFKRLMPNLSQRVSWISGDVRDFVLPKNPFDILIHAATDVVAEGMPGDVFSTCLDGTRRILELANRCGVGSLLLVSSGAVYGPLPAGMTHVPETYIGGPDPLRSESAYGEGKRVSEWLTVNAASPDLEIKIARLFAFVGPYLPLNKHFAIGNFLASVMLNQPIIIKGDGTPYRSYLYAADMAAWLWAVLLQGQSCRAYNVGSEDSLSIFDLAQRVTRVLGCKSNIQVLRPSLTPARPVHYVPDTRRARHELGLPQVLSLDDAILRTAAWYGAR